MAFSALIGLSLWVGSCFWARADGAEASPFAPRVEWTRSRLQGSPDPPLPYRVERVFPGRTFANPVYLAQEPGSNRVLVGQLDGKIFAFDKRDAAGETRTLFLDVKRQLYSFSFHPDYERNGQFFTFTPQSEGDDQQSAVSRWTTRQVGDVRTANEDSEHVIVQWPSGGHNGGEAIFGPDGMLYVSTGDSTSGSDPKATGQGVDDFLSVILRIDVDHPPDGKPYSVPADNPFCEVPDARPEVWAFGFRNPWRMSFHPDNGTLYVGDVGQDLWEMIWIARRGGNYGWSVREGSHPFHPHKPVGPGPILPPLIEHPHVECRSITGGYVYRGTRLPELDGAYLYGDYQYGKIWGLRHEGDRVTWHAELADSALQIPSFALGRDGEFWVLDHLSGEIHELLKSPVQAPTAPFPRTLSDTGLFLDTATHALAPGVVRYEVNMPQWLNDAVAERFFGLPPETTIRFVEQSGDANTWGFADGAVTAETISVADRSRPDGLRRLETRVMVKQDDHWLGYSYLWNDAQTDAELVARDGTTISLPDSVITISHPDQTPLREWRVPARSECMVCHSRAAGFVLGLNTLQINRTRSLVEDGAQANQMMALSDAGYFHEPLPRPVGEYDALPQLLDETADLTRRARAYLQVNCSMCHVSDGGGNARFQVRYDLPTDQMALLDEPAIHGEFGLENARLIASGDPYASVVFYRLSKTGTGRMPHIGSETQDVAAIRLMHDWIAALSPSTEAAQSTRIWTDDLLRQFADADLEPGVEPFAGLTPRQALALSHALTDPGVPIAARRAVARRVREQSPALQDLFERFLPPEERTERLGDDFSPDRVLSQSGDAGRGRALFFAQGVLQCANCHQPEAEDGGLAVGPSLRGIGSRYSPRQILDAMIHPSHQIADEYRTYVAVTGEGRIVTGLLAVQTEEAVTLRHLEGNAVREEVLPRAEIEELIAQPVSLMPENQLRDLTAQQAADLLAYLVSLAN